MRRLFEWTHGRRDALPDRLQLSWLEDTGHRLVEIQGGFLKLTPGQLLDERTGGRLQFQAIVRRVAGFLSVSKRNQQQGGTVNGNTQEGSSKHCFDIRLKEAENLVCADSVSSGTTERLQYRAPPVPSDLSSCDTITLFEESDFFIPF